MEKLNGAINVFQVSENNFVICAKHYNLLILCNFINSFEF